MAVFSLIHVSSYRAGWLTHICSVCYGLGVRRDPGNLGFEVLGIRFKVSVSVSWG